MILEHISLVNYKNFKSESFQFNQKINCFIGHNGVGKTNVLDAIYHLSYSKSYFNSISSQNINHEADFFVIDGQYKKEDRDEKIIVSLKKGQKKIIKRNGKIYERFSDHIGFLPLVIISPSDTDLISSGSEVRRKFVDSIISQLDKHYLTTLIKYTKTLAQRNALLKYFALNSTFNTDTLAVYNEQLVVLGTQINDKRKTFITDFIPIFLKRYKTLSNDVEIVKLTYKSQLNDTGLAELFIQNLQKDRVLQYTSVGVHKDDFVFTINGYPIKKFGSQGQQKTFLIALKLAQFDFLSKQTQVKPILLLDDIFDKLDETRVAQLIALVNEDAFGQIFISDTHAKRTEAVLEKTNQSYEIFKL